MCKRVPGSGSIRFVMYRATHTSKKMVVEYVSRATGNSGDIYYTDDIWEARTWFDRKDLNIALEYLRRKNSALMPHEALASMSTVEDKEFKV